MKMYVKNETVTTTRDYISKPFLKIGGLEVSLISVFLGAILQDYEYISFGTALYQTLYQK